MCGATTVSGSYLAHNGRPFTCTVVAVPIAALVMGGSQQPNRWLSQPITTAMILHVLYLSLQTRHRRRLEGQMTIQPSNDVMMWWSTYPSRCRKRSRSRDRFGQI